MRCVRKIQGGTLYVQLPGMHHPPCLATGSRANEWAGECGVVRGMRLTARSRSVRARNDGKHPQPVCTPTPPGAYLGTTFKGGSRFPLSQSCRDEAQRCLNAALFSPSPGGLTGEFTSSRGDQTTLLFDTGRAHKTMRRHHSVELLLQVEPCKEAHNGRTSPPELRFVPGHHPGPLAKGGP
ncbi:hypothetical protein HPB51_022550 [Rhipicephalus microplus]|uniref:Uncharacterized protein n=1 Tax=Rhipicephalus microplus TaxID=6941 RepID=A0A9J6DCM3_RHIMP|nr:hypothetical protein HPB51_022550 [Rhipicephalus microplus]